MEALYILLIGMFLEICFDWPKLIYEKIKHPVVWIGSLIKILDNNFNKKKYTHYKRKVLGFFSLIICLIVSLFFFFLTSMLLRNIFFVEIFYIFIIWAFVCSRSLFSHINQISNDIEENNLYKAKVSLSKVVGRDTHNLRKKQVIRASLESLSESTSDGIVAPIFWYFLLGIPGLIVFKTVNTLDSMIGYKTEKYFSFGYASAKLDDLLNYLPSRLTGLMIVVLSSKPFNTFKIMISNASKLSSPNAGWPEAAFAGALLIRLGGPKTYLGITNNDKWLNEKYGDPTYEKLKEGLRLYKRLILFIIFIIFLIIILQFFEAL